MYNPRWNDEFKKINPDAREMDSRKERLACDVMIDVKEEELKLSQKARQFEGDRKDEWRKWRAEEARKQKNKELQIEKAKVYAQQYLAKKLKEKKEKNERDKK